jgi:lipopolysaccharide/colanic/teichoic acid biosynthesis glycosyltransferase
LKRIFDIVLSAALLVAASPLLTVMLVATWSYDRYSPFYIAPRVGRGGKLFKMVKLRSMVINADRAGGTSTSATDRRITPVGHFIRRYKLDELMQLWNVLKGDMSLVGPRPNVPPDVALYTKTERRLLTVKPGITDFASVVFSDEGDILAGQTDPDIAYNQLIRPGKSRLGIFYVENASILVDLQLLGLTALAMVSKARALRGVVAILQRLGAPADLIEIAKRERPLVPAPPPGATTIVTSLDTIPV